MCLFFDADCCAVRYMELKIHVLQTKVIVFYSMKSTIASYIRINIGKIDEVDRMLTKDENVTEKSV